MQCSSTLEIRSIMIVSYIILLSHYTIELPFSMLGKSHTRWLLWRHKCIFHGFVSVLRLNHNEMPKMAKKLPSIAYQEDRNWKYPWWMYCGRYEYMIYNAPTRSLYLHQRPSIDMAHIRQNDPKIYNQWGHNVPKLYHS